MTNANASAPKLSKKGTIVIEFLMQARSMTAHSSLFLAKMPRNRQSLPSAWIAGLSPSFSAPSSMMISEDYPLQIGP